jgi:CDP-6-deoxy-D-xylo-4-hexulose-3-dehydrase
MELSTFLENKGIQTRPIFAGNILKQPGFKDIAKPDFRKNFPNANSIMERGLLIGCNNGLGEKHIKYMKDSFKTFLDKF